ncbi:MAG: hypothetical protein HY912_16360, partial [Desulfomonile tiedjei]|nr:hypothetical protein [Desulfomonile tiedjei]
MLINEAGKSHQVELTPFGLRLGVTVSLGLVVLFAAAFIWLGGTVSGGRANSQEDALAEKVRSLQAELQKKELALAFQEKRLKEAQESPTLAAALPRTGTDEGPAKASASGSATTGSRERSPLTGIQESFRPQAVGPAKNLGGDDDLEEREAPSELGSALGKSASGSASEPSALSPAEVGAGLQGSVSFNAQEVAATAVGPSNGTLSFRLIKDHPDIRFSGYLFVFVEMADPRGENKIYAYPKRARLGEEDLPVDFREGESISFKHNSRVELPYEDIRSGASLGRVSILLYGENGKIVFQRGFERNELKSVTHKSNAPRPAASDANRHR